MTGARVILAALLALGLAFAAPDRPAAAGETLGVVVLHGKDARPPHRPLVQLEQALTAAGLLFEEPEMPWSGRRGFDVDYEQAMAEIDAAVARLKARGASAIAVAGHSLGANAAIGYGARHPGLKGIVALAPGHLPDAYATKPAFVGSVAEARAMIASGHGNDSATFTDAKHGQTFQRQMVARIYLSYFAPDGPAVIPANAARLTAPLLWVAGSRDPLSSFGPDYAFAKAPANPHNHFATVNADHAGTPDAAAELVVAWLKGL